MAVGRGPDERLSTSASSQKKNKINLNEGLEGFMFIPSVPHFPVCYRYFDCFDSFSGWYGMVVLQVVFDSLIFVRHLIV